MRRIRHEVLVGVERLVDRLQQLIDNGCKLADLVPAGEAQAAAEVPPRGYLGSMSRDSAQGPQASVSNQPSTGSPGAHAQRAEQQQRSPEPGQRVFQGLPRLAHLEHARHLTFDRDGHAQDSHIPAIPGGNVTEDPLAVNSWGILGGLHRQWHLVQVVGRGQDVVSQIQSLDVQARCVQL